MQAVKGNEYVDSDTIGDEFEKAPIRDELSKMSFEELQQLKQRLGSKVYNEAMYGTSNKKRKQHIDFKRDNKNRPQEMSSKIQVSAFPGKKFSEKNVARDPRFDSLCGEFKEETFNSSYSFLDNIREREKAELKSEMQSNVDDSRKEKIKYLIQRMENQEREKNKRKRKANRDKQYRDAKIEALRQGQKPHHQNKSEKRVLDLVDQYEDLKKSGKLQKHIEKQRKKNATKDRKKLETL